MPNRVRYLDDEGGPGYFVARCEKAVLISGRPEQAASAGGTGRSGLSDQALGVLEALPQSRATLEQPRDPPELCHADSAW
jgi:hypothetical protein